VIVDPFSTAGMLVHFIFPNGLIVHHPNHISHVEIFPAGRPIAVRSHHADAGTPC
jgi:hypothetical protein